MRIWKADSGADQEPETALDAEEPITSLCTDVRIRHITVIRHTLLTIPQNDGWLSGSEDSHVRRYLKMGTEMESLITRANAIPIRYISVDPKGRRIAVASE